MFGDVLTHEKCTELILSLSKCEFCFICAHGRPSVIPLIDMNDAGKPSPTERSQKSESFKCSEVRSGPKRVIRQRIEGNAAASFAKRC